MGALGQRKKKKRYVPIPVQGARVGRNSAAYCAKCPSETVYDLAGRVMARVDALGNATCTDDRIAPACPGGWIRPHKI